jgi:type IV secretion system protein VirB9
VAALHVLVAFTLVKAAAGQVSDPTPPPAPDAVAKAEAVAAEPLADAGQGEALPPPEPEEVAVPPQLPSGSHLDGLVSPSAMPGDNPTAVDARTPLVAYDPDRIFTLGVSQGYASVVELAPDERVENLVVGNSAAWQVTANRRGDRVIVKPLAGASPSNMIVLTASRRYVFMLDPFSQTSFIMRFSYPQAVEAVTAAAAPVDFTFRGDKALFPLAMSDDGRRTVIDWGAHKPLPAIFAMSDRNRERLVNGRMVGNSYVVEGTAARYRFRYGNDEATAIRQTPKKLRR